MSIEKNIGTVSHSSGVLCANTLRMKNILVLNTHLSYSLINVCDSRKIGLL